MTWVDHVDLEGENVIDEFRGDYQFLSNFYPSEITRNGISYPTAEHFFQAHKAIDIENHFYIAGLKTPNEAKRVGRRVELRESWEIEKYHIMHVAVTLKFFQNSYLGDMLLETGDAMLLEGNTWNDTVWGVIWDDSTGAWIGRNHLGDILMDVRNGLRKG